MKVCGIDMASAKPSTFAFIDDKLVVNTLVDYNELSHELFINLMEGNVSVIAIDSPLGFPSGMCCLEESCPCQASNGNGRLAERELSKLGISSYYTTKKTIIKPMIYKAIQWTQVLRNHGFKVIEIYPYATKVRLFGKPVPSKTKKLASLKELVVELGFDTDSISQCNHDQIDAILAAYTGLLYVQRNTDEVGDVTESKIVIPKEKSHLQGVFNLEL